MTEDRAVELIHGVAHDWPLAHPMPAGMARQIARVLLDEWQARPAAWEVIISGQVFITTDRGRAEKYVRTMHGGSIEPLFKGSST